MKATAEVSACVRECQAEMINTVCQLTDSADKLVALADIVEELSAAPSDGDHVREVRRLASDIETQVLRSLRSAMKALGAD